MWKQKCHDYRSLKYNHRIITTHLSKEKRERSWYTDWATGWTTQNLWFDSRQREEIVFFFFYQIFQTALRPTQLPIQWAQLIFTRAKRQRPKAD